MAEGKANIKVSVDVTDARMLGCIDNLYALVREAVFREFSAFDNGWLERARAVVDFVENGSLLAHNAGSDA